MLSGKICVVTGGSQGIGRKISELFSERNADIVYVCDMNIESLEEVKKEHPAIKPVKLNVCDRDAINSFVETLKDKHEKVDVLVNNAGVIRDNLIDRLSEQDWDVVIDVNLKGVFNMTQAIAPVMMETGVGSIINMSSIVGTDGNVGQSNYAATKGGVIAMTKGWAKEFARKGAQVRANCVAPGFIATPMTEDLPEKVLDYMKQKTPLGRMGTPQDIADGVLFLASDLSKFITGQTLKIDGGLTL